MITLTVNNLIITSNKREAISGNRYDVRVVLDAEWTGLDAVVRVCYTGGSDDYSVTSGSTSIVIPDNVSEIEVGVYAGRLSTTNREKIHILPSILSLTANSEEVEI